VAGLTESTSRALYRMVAERQRTQRVPGMFAAIGRDGRTLWQAGLGSADLNSPGIPPTSDTQFRIASISKTFTAVLVMALRDEGKLSLDDSVDKHVPESGHGAITIRQMLSHVTGMQREPVGDVWDTLAYPDRTELVQAWNDAERILRPHHRWHYSNLAYSILGELVVRLEEREWRESLQARILEPLGMRRTSVGFSGDAVTGYYLPPYSDVPVPEPVPDLAAMASAGGLASTSEDLLAWGAFLADPTDEVLSPDTVEEMCQPQIMADLEKWELAWGLGFELLRAEDRVFVGHTGGLPGHITALFAHRPSSTSAVALMNSSSASDPGLLAVELAGHVVEHNPADPPLWTPGTAVPGELADLLGRWFMGARPIDFHVRHGRLEARDPEAPGASPSVFAEVAEGMYRTTSGPNEGELLRITRDRNGAPTKMHWATYPYTRDPRALGDAPSPSQPGAQSGEISSSSRSL
jgi:CubicO group peptidase (beta-lactamase class C family)